MKISRGGTSPLGNVGRGERAKKTKEASNKAFVDHVDKASAVTEVESMASVEVVDSPVYDAMASASQDFQSGQATLEEATRAVVSAIIREHFGKKELPPAEVEKITLAVTDSIGGDDSLRSRLETTLRRITNERVGR